MTNIAYCYTIAKPDLMQTKRIEPFFGDRNGISSEMAAPAVINVTKINASDIQFAEPRRNKNGGVSIGFKYNNQNVQFRIPQVTFPGGLNVKENPNKDGSVTVSYTMAASMNGGDPYGVERSVETTDTAKLYNFMLDLQERVIRTAVDRSTSWFGKKRSEDSIRDSFNKFVSCSVDKTDNGWVPNGKYPPSLRMKLPVYDGKIAMEMIDSEDNDIVLTTDTLSTVFAKGCSAKLVLQAQIYMVGQSFGVTWKPTYGQVFQRKKASARDFFKRDEDDIEEAEAEDEVEETVEETVPEVQAPAPNTASVAEETPVETSKPARRRKVA